MRDALDLLTLHAPAGNGQINEPADIAALDASLRRIEAYTPPPEYADEPQRYPTEPLIRALEGFQEQSGLKIDGYANPGGPTERAINNRLLAKPRGAGLLLDPPAPLAGTVGNGFDNRPADVAAVQRLLGAAGDLPEDPFDRPRGYIDESTTRAIQSFQRKAGLADDGWLAPNGETERALRAAVADLARANGRDWLAFAERAGRAQARMTPLSTTRVQTTWSDQAGPTGVTPAAWHGAQEDHVRPALPGLPNATGPGDEEARVEAAQTAPGDWFVPFMFLTLPGLLGLGEANRQRAERRRTGDDDAGGKTEFIPPRADDRPYAGQNPTTPPLDPGEMRPAPYPARPPLTLPQREEVVPPRRDPREQIEIHPDQSDWIARLPIFVENRQGSPPVKELNRALGKPVIAVGKRVFPAATIEQTGGPPPNNNGKYSEDFDGFRFKEEFGINSNAGGSYKDVSYRFEYNGVNFEVVINTISTAGPNGAPVSREDRQRAKMVLNARTHTLIIDVDKLRPDETIDWRAWDGFLESRLRYVKWLIDKKVMTTEGFDHRLLDKFTERNETITSFVSGVLQCPATGSPSA